MFFCFALTLLFIQSISSFDLRYMNKASDMIFNDETLFSIMNKDFSAIKKANDDGYQFSMFDETEYLNFKYFISITITSGDGTLNATEIAETWYIGSLNQSRTQVVEYVGGANDEGVAVEAIAFGDEEYVIFQNGADVYCEIQNYSNTPALYYTYYDTMFITPDYDDFSVVWGPRLIDVYYSDYEQSTIILGLDSFTEDLVLYVDYITNTSTKALFVHEISYEKFDSSYVTVPLHVNCSAAANENVNQVQKPMISSFRTTLF